MTFTGPYPTKFSGNTNEMLISATAFSGGVTNAGTIGTGGVIVTSSTFQTGGFLNSSLISGAPTGIAVLAHSTIHGAIVDSGSILATQRGIQINGGVVSGGIAVGKAGLMVASSGAGRGIVVENTSTFGGGIVNSGTISAGASAIRVDTVSSFAGGISNTGTLTGGRGITVNGVAFFGTAGAGGGIVNKGTIATHHTAIEIHSNVGVFGSTSAGGGILNSGMISAAAGDAIFLLFVPTFAGGIGNAGTIMGHTQAVAVRGGILFAGGISNSGLISAADGAAINIHETATFSGSISNRGAIAGILRNSR